ncbi:MAG: hypothetical protein PHY92_00910 [Alphaproteobacteria bacterium]|nr:hypothetical protein [Alphaproteobacteria bacterium]
MSQFEKLNELIAHSLELEKEIAATGDTGASFDISQKLRIEKSGVDGQLKELAGKLKKDLETRRETRVDFMAVAEKLGEQDMGAHYLDQALGYEQQIKTLSQIVDGNEMPKAELPVPEAGLTDEDKREQLIDEQARLNRLIFLAGQNGEDELKARLRAEREKNKRLLRNLNGQIDEEAPEETDRPEVQPEDEQPPRPTTPFEPTPDAAVRPTGRDTQQPVDTRGLKNRLLSGAVSLAPTVAVGALTGVVSKLGLQWLLASAVTTVPAFASIAALPLMTPLFTGAAVLALAGGISGLAVAYMSKNQEAKQGKWRTKAFMKGFAVGGLAGAGIYLGSLYGLASLGAVGIFGAGSLTGVMTRVGATVMEGKRSLKDLAKAVGIGAVVGGFASLFASELFAAPDHTGLTHDDRTGADPNPLWKEPGQTEPGTPPATPGTETPAPGTETPVAPGAGKTAPVPGGEIPEKGAAPKQPMAGKTAPAQETYRGHRTPQHYAKLDSGLSRADVDDLHRTYGKIDHALTQQQSTKVSINNMRDVMGLPDNDQALVNARAKSDATFHKALYKALHPSVK